jgi:tripartite-type tricarboxylate transporter receptor subunit TctC
VLSTTIRVIALAPGDGTDVAGRAMAEELAKL